ncbi:MAG: hypothetical protein KKH94_07210 [Candidatus Omnitrophica bacterium]|nr:hypothetical protein [Candidatus Omnitrophota bacterium]
MRLLIGNFEETFNEFFGELFEDASIETYFAETDYELVLKMDMFQPDAVLFITNNVQTTPWLNTASERNEKMFAVVASLKKYGKPIIALSTWESDIIKKRFYDAGVDYYLRLPCDVEALVKLVTQAGAR